MEKSEPSTLVLIEKERVMNVFSFLLFASIVFFTSCSDNKFLVKGQTYNFDEVVIVNRGGTNYSHKGSAIIYDNKVKISAGKINNTFNIENVEYDNTSDEKVVVFELSLNGDDCKAEFHKTDDNIMYLKVMKDDYQENVMIPCDNFIQIGKKYSFDSNSITKGQMTYEYDEGFAVFSQNSLTITIGDFSKTFNILKSSYFKNEDSPNYRADFTVLNDGEECEAQFGIGGRLRTLYINFPKPSNEFQYRLFWYH